MWESQKDDSNSAEPINPLKDAVRDARIEAAERSGVVVDLRDADVARLELLNEALDPLFKDVPGDVELFDRGVSKGDVPTAEVVVRDLDELLYGRWAPNREALHTSSGIQQGLPRAVKGQQKLDHFFSCPAASPAQRRRLEQLIPQVEAGTAAFGAPAPL